MLRTTLNCWTKFNSRNIGLKLNNSLYGINSYINFLYSTDPTKNKYSSKKIINENNNINNNRRNKGSGIRNIDPQENENNKIYLSPKRRFFSARTSFIILILWLGISFSCLGYVYWHKIPPSRLMYIQPILLNINPERAHLLAVKVAQWPRWIRRCLGMINKTDRDPLLNTSVFGLKFLNPIGLAAGFDKHGECIDGMLDMGFGFMEIGSITPQPQLGNPKPRVFRLTKDKAVINRYGFNSHGHEKVKQRLEERLEKIDRSLGYLGINLGKNKTSKDPINDYILGIKKFIHLGDYFVVNVSSPNTPGLRDMQKYDILYNLLNRVKNTLIEEHNKLYSNSIIEESIPDKPPLLVKISPDLNDSDLNDIANVCMSLNIDGIIVGNTTINRPNTLKSNNKLINEKGGLSGRPLFDMSNEILKKLFVLTKGKIPLIGVGGIKDAKDAYKKIKCGASLIQLYTGLVYGGPVVIKRMLRELGQYAELDDFKHINEAVGKEAYDEQLLDKYIPISEEEQILMNKLLPRGVPSIVAKAYGIRDHITEQEYIQKQNIDKL